MWLAEVPFPHSARKRKLRRNQRHFLILCMQSCSTPQSSRSSHHFGTAAIQQLWGRQRWAAPKGADRGRCCCSVSALSYLWKIIETSWNVPHLQQGKHCTYLQKMLEDDIVSCQRMGIRYGWPALIKEALFLIIQTAPIVFLHKGKLWMLLHYQKENNVEICNSPLHSQLYVCNFCAK